MAGEFGAVGRRYRGRQDRGPLAVGEPLLERRDHSHCVSSHVHDPRLVHGERARGVGPHAVAVKDELGRPGLRACEVVDATGAGVKGAARIQLQAPERGAGVADRLRKGDRRLVRAGYRGRGYHGRQPVGDPHRVVERHAVAGRVGNVPRAVVHQADVGARVGQQAVEHEDQRVRVPHPGVPGDREGDPGAAPVLCKADLVKAGERPDRFGAGRRPRDALCKVYRDPVAGRRGRRVAGRRRVHRRRHGKAAHRADPLARQVLDGAVRPRQAHVEHGAVVPGRGRPLLRRQVH